jgi:sugar lactone lactonase YvrE
MNKSYYIILILILLSSCSGENYIFNIFVTTVAGEPGLSGSDDGLGNNARFNGLIGIVADAGGSIVISDWGNQTIRKISPSGQVTTYSGYAGIPGFVDSVGESARFDNPRGIGIDFLGNIYVADQGNNVIRKISSNGFVTTLAGKNGEIGYADGVGINAKFNNPRGLTIDRSGNIYVADQGNNIIRKISQSGLVSTYAGKAGEAGSLDGDPQTARFRSPEDVAVDLKGNIFVVDSGNNTIRKISSDGKSVTTFAGVAGEKGAVDGFGAEIRLNSPRGIAIDCNNNLIIADTLNHLIRLISKESVSKTIAGIALQPGFEDGHASKAKFNFPRGVAVDSLGAIYVTDQSNHVVRKIHMEYNCSSD